MEYQKILNEADNSKFVATKWNIINDQSNAKHDLGNEIIYNTEVSKFKVCNYKDTYILVRIGITIIGHNVTQVAFKNCAPFTKCIATVDDAEDLVILHYNLIEHSSKYSDTTGNLWFCSKDEPINL